MEEELELSPISVMDRQAQINLIIERLMSQDLHLSYSALSAFKRSPIEFIEYKLKERKSTPAMEFGIMLHCLILEPEKFTERYFVLEDQDICIQIGGAKPRATKAYKEWVEVAFAENPGKILVKDQDYKNATVMANNVRFNRASAKCLNACPEREKPIEWEYKNFKWKGVIDMDGEKEASDLKMVPDASPRKAQRTILENGYHIQGAMYLTGLDVIKPYNIICVDKKGGVSVHRIDKHLMEYALEEYEKLVDHFNRCILEDRFNQSHDFWSERFDGLFVVEKANYMF